MPTSRQSFCAQVLQNVALWTAAVMVVLSGTPHAKLVGQRRRHGHARFGDRHVRRLRFRQRRSLHAVSVGGARRVRVEQNAVGADAFLRGLAAQ